MPTFTPTLFWLTGLSGAGKTTIGALLTERLRERGDPVIFLDGDILREVYKDSIGHDRDSRLAAAMQYARLCKMLVDQQVHVVCATISLFHQIQNWNRHHIKNYLEVYIDVPMDELIKRDSKQIYSRAVSGKLSNIVGIDIQPEFPMHADIIIKNFINSTMEDNVNLILNHYDVRISYQEKNNASNMGLHHAS
jgi:cytidine diphosphoramidate kinase